MECRSSIDQWLMMMMMMKVFISSQWRVSVEGIIRHLLTLNRGCLTVVHAHDPVV